MTKKGISTEISDVRKCFKDIQGWGFRAPGSGGTTSTNELIDPSVDTEILAAQIPIDGIPFVPYRFKIDYLNADCTLFVPEWKEVRVIELKTVRLRKSMLSNEEKQLSDADRKKIRRKERVMIETFQLLEYDNRQWIKTKQHDPKTNREVTVEIHNPHFKKLRKSDFCFELERTRLFAHRLRNSGAFAVPVRPYLQVRFISSYAEIYIDIDDLAHYDDISKATPRDPIKTVLVIEKNDQNTIRWYWRHNNAYKIEKDN